MEKVKEDEKQIRDANVEIDKLRGEQDRLTDVRI